MVEKTVDYTGFRCPIPVLKTKKELKNLTSGQIIEVISDDIGSKKDIPAMLKKTGDELIEIREEDKSLIFKIKKT